MTSCDRPALICFSHLRWNFVFQRPQQLMTRAASEREVLFVEEPLFEPRTSGYDIQMERVSDGVRVIRPVLDPDTTANGHIRAQKQIVDQLLLTLEVPDRFSLWYYTPMALRFTAHLRPAACIYDCMDELTAFRFAPSQLQNLESRLLQRAQVMFVGGASLYRAKRDRHPSCHLFPSSVDTPHFAAARARTALEPADQRAIAHPRVGFFGVIDERMDLQLLAELADLRPDLNLVLLGPTAKLDPAVLPRRPNIHWLGLKQYAELPAYLAGWDAGFMPFALNEATRFISPTKTPEFLAAGVPLVSTPIRDVVRPYGESGLVDIVSDAPGLAAGIDRVMHRDRAPWLARVDEHLRNESWDRTWTAMSELIMQVEDTRPRRKSRSAVEVSQRAAGV